MPKYEYECMDCQKKFSLILSVKDKEAKNPKCPSCKGTKLEQQITAFQIKTSKKS